MVTSMGFTDHYELGENTSLLSLNAAKSLAGGDYKRIWFVREGESDEEELDPDDPDFEPLDTPWTVEPWRGQFVNCLGFFVSTMPRRPAHDDTIFEY